MGDDDERDDDVAELRALIERARPADVVWEPPPADLWDRIAAEIDQEQVPAPATQDAVAPVVPITGRRRRAWWVGLGVAAAAVVVVVTLAITRRGDDATVVATVELERLGDTGSGRAELRRSRRDVPGATGDRGARSRRRDTWSCG